MKIEVRKNAREICTMRTFLMTELPKVAIVRIAKAAGAELVSEASETVQQADFIAGEIHKHYRCVMESDEIWEVISEITIKLESLHKIW